MRDFERSWSSHDGYCRVRTRLDSSTVSYLPIEFSVLFSAPFAALNIIVKDREGSRALALPPRYFHISMSELSAKSFLATISQTKLPGRGSMSIPAC
jgi:hypothetical protein